MAGALAQYPLFLLLVALLTAPASRYLGRVFGGLLLAIELLIGGLCFLAVLVLVLGPVAEQFSMRPPGSISAAP